MPALETALALLDDQRVDRYLSAGDAVGYGPHPNECIDRLRDVGAVSVAGNHELYLLDRLPPRRFSTRARTSLAWTRSVVGSERFRWLSTLPDRATLGPIVMAHASLDDPEDYVVRPWQAKRQLGLLRSMDPDAKILVLGHTHQPLYRTEDGRARPVRGRASRALSTRRTLVNPGSIGQSRQWERVPRARFALLDLDRWTVRWFAVGYDHAAVLRDLEAVGLPPDSIHVRPSAPLAVARLIRAHTDLSVPRLVRSGAPR
ncbi:MAG: metallophosphoesterase family protein [Chloroflexi bacterium]|nr:metallophosphoesterase family protein [Chloroflexota bacterium]